MTSLHRTVLLSTSLVFALAGSMAAGGPPPLATGTDAGLVVVELADGSVELLGRCGSPRPPAHTGSFAGLAAADCSANATNPDPTYDPGEGFLIDVWVHVLEHTSGKGDVPDSEISDQIAVLNEDFRALAGTLGENGNDARIFFRLAGTTHTVSNTAYNDAGDYWTALAVDPGHYLNIYTNNASGYLGYAWVPQDLGASVGEDFDRVVIFWKAFGRGNGYTPYDLGRTTTHEVGHYLGLYHTFDGCDSGSCNTSGDLICDTANHTEPDFYCVVTPSSCSGNPETPIENYMNYTPDTCMEEFTVEQRRRIRCSVEFWRPGIGTPILFYDGFENGTLAWSEVAG